MLLATLVRRFATSATTSANFYPPAVSYMSSLSCQPLTPAPRSP